MISTKQTAQAIHLSYGLLWGHEEVVKILLGQDGVDPNKQGMIAVGEHCSGALLFMGMRRC